MLAEFVRRGSLEAAAAADTQGWPHSGFGTYFGPPIIYRVGRLRVADRVDGPCAGKHRRSVLEFIARSSGQYTPGRRGYALGTSSASARGLPRPLVTAKKSGPN